MDGADERQIFFYVTLPLMAHLALIALTLRLIDSFKVFDIIYGLTRGGPGSATELLGMRIYRTGFQHSNLIGRDSAYAVMILLLAPLFTALSRTTSTYS